jgi:hypothetical protein
MSTVSPLPSVGQTIAALGAVTTEVPVQPFTNTKEVIVANFSTTTRCFVAWGDPAILVLTAANSTIIPAAAAISLAIGPEGIRNPAELGGGLAKMALLLAMEAGTGEINVTYVNIRGINSSGGI